MKIYTRKGDEGITSLIGGSRVPKHHLRIESYGTVDELNSWVGLLRDQDIRSEYKDVLIAIQDRLFVIGSHLANEEEQSRMQLPQLEQQDVEALERQIDAMDEVLPAMRNFILPGGHPSVSYCHIARCVCRRAERLTVQLHESYNVQPLILHYLNRLSDYLFVLGRIIAQDLGAEQLPWKPRG